MKEVITKFNLEMIGDFIQSKAETTPNEYVNTGCSLDWVTAQMAKQLFPKHYHISSGYTDVKIDDKNVVIDDGFKTFLDYVIKYERNLTITWYKLNKHFKEWS